MSPLCAGDHRFIKCLGVIWRGIHCQQHGFGSDQVHPTPSNVAARPIVPKNRETSEGRRWQRKRLRRSEEGSRGDCLRRREWGERPEHGTDPSWFACGRAFLTLLTQRAVPASADAGGIQHPVGAIALRPAFLWVEGMAGGTEQASIGLKRKS